MIKGVLKRLPLSVRNRYRPAWRFIKNNVFYSKLTRWIFCPSVPKMEDGSVFLHLGCGSVNHPRFINIDAVPAPHVHYVRRIENLSLFKDNSVDLIYASHCLEHFSHRGVTEVLQEWFRVLKKGGILRVSVPDFDLLLNIYRDNGNEINSIIMRLMGGQEYKYNFHYTVFTKSSLSALLIATGFMEIKEWKPGSSELTTFDDWSSRKITFDGKKYPVSLNLEAIK